ncbi:MAG: CAP domain-containing protein [Verrucomicrobiales bacterium]|nr:CAP domain-containing protein [Verrucomicrobiales bacterium]
MKIYLIAVAFVTFSLGIGQEDLQRSLNQGADQVAVRVSNGTSAPLTLSWVDFTGGIQDFGVVSPGEEVILDTNPGHLWVLGDGKQAVVRYRATAAAQQSLALGGSAAPVSSSFPPTPPPTISELVTPSLPQQTGSKLSPREAAEFLDFHNQVRAEVGVAPVAWSPEIARVAQEWADELARKGKFEHRPRGARSYGENLAAGSGASYSPVQGAKQWYAEKKLFRSTDGVFTASLMPAGHYTQMVWRGSTEIGAGKAVVQRGQMKGWTVVVCNYNPPGNMVGGKVY